MPGRSQVEKLVLVLGDQLDPGSTAFECFDPKRDVVWMAEVSREAKHVWCHKARIAMFLSAMRHFRNQLSKRGIKVHYRQIDQGGPGDDFVTELQAAVRKLRPARIVMVEPGEWRVRQMFRDAATALGVDLEMRPDRHFICSHEEFAAHARGRKQLRLEYFYRELRRKHDVLMDGDQPLGGRWNYDAENRGSFSKSGPEAVPPPMRFRPDATTREVLELVADRFADHPGSLEQFDWPVTSGQATRGLHDFVRRRLGRFGLYQDAMWAGEPYLYHSRLSAALNLKLLDPRKVIGAAVNAYETGLAPLNSVEGFVRQILGWREYVRGIYWLHMPEYIDRNALEAKQPLPGFYWTGDTEMNCLRETIDQTLKFGYAHHIQRLMITGLFALLLGIDPKEVHRWYLAVYVDAVEWVELPNTLGMSQFADGGLMASKPYAATGKYIQRMSNYCASCRYNPDKASETEACPFTTLYWDFLMRHQKRLAKNQRMSLQMSNLKRKSPQEREAIRKRAAALRTQWSPHITKTREP